MIIDEFTKALTTLGLKKGDTLFVSSDITMLLYDALKSKERLNPDNIIDTMYNLVGDNGNLIFPTYNWDFCKGETFDYKNTPSRTGSLTQIALERPDFIRTKHPIYSFAVKGRDSKYLSSLEYKDSFGADSIFSWFEKIGAKNLFINISYEHSATFVHFVEERCNVPYRFIKTFNANYIDENGTETNRDYSMYVRYLDRDVITTIDPMHEVFLENNAVKELKFYNSTLRLLDMPKAYTLTEDNILNHNYDRVAIVKELVKEQA